MRSLAILGCFLLVFSTSCLDEDKSGCRTDGDCRGVRVCKQSVCLTPPGFEEAVAPDDTDSLGPSQSCGEPSAPFVFEVDAESLGVDALREGVSGTLLAEEGDGTLVVELDLGGRLTLRLDAPSSVASFALDLAAGAPLVLRATEGSFLEISSDGQLLLAVCSEEVGADAAIICEGEGWSVYAGGAPLCEAVEESCEDGQVQDLVRFAVVVDNAQVGTSELYGGEGEVLESGEVSWTHVVSDAHFSPAPCGAPGLVNAAIWRAGLAR